MLHPLLIAGLLTALGTPYEDKRDAADTAAAALEYSSAAVLWEEAVALAETEDERIAAHLGAGIARRIVGDDVDARLHFVYVLKRRPKIVLDATHPPRIRDFFELIRDEVAEPDVEPEVPEPVVEPVETPAETPVSAAVWIAAGAATLSAASFVAGGVSGTLAQNLDNAALVEDVQLARVALYDQRDDLALLANVAFVSGGVFAALAAGALLWPEAQ